MTAPGPPGGVQVSPQDLERVAAAADLCGADLNATRRRWQDTAAIVAGSAPEPTTNALLDAAHAALGRRLDSNARAMTDLADGLRVDASAFTATDRAGAGDIAAALEPGAPPR